MTDDLTKDPDIKAVTARVETLEGRVATLVIHNPMQFEIAAEDLLMVKQSQKQVEALRVKITGPLNEALRAANDFFRAPADRLKNMEDKIKRAIASYNAAQEAKRREEQRIADEAAAKARREAEAAAREAERVAREKADRERAEADRQRKIEEEAAAKAAEARAAGDAEAARVAEAAQAEAAKLAAKSEDRAVATEEKAAERAEVLQTRADTAVAPVIYRAPPKVSGVSTRKVWKFRIKDETKIPRLFLMVDEAKIRRQVNATQGETQIPGVEVYAEDQIAAGAR